MKKTILIIILALGALGCKDDTPDPNKHEHVYVHEHVEIHEHIDVHVHDVPQCNCGIILSHRSYYYITTGWEYYFTMKNDCSKNTKEIKVTEDFYYSDRYTKTTVCLKNYFW